VAGAGGRDRPGPGSYLATTWTLLGAAFLLVLILVSVRCPLGPSVSRDYPSRTLPPDVEPVLLASAPPDEFLFPCSDCHEGEPTDPTRRILEEDHEIPDLAHGDLWCLHCHDTDQRDDLRLSDGTLIEFGNSWRQCGQCHGHRLEEWQEGIHGKRTGHWWGETEYQPCVACHDPHAPRFERIVPMPPPKHPTEIVWPPASAAVAGGATDGIP
jgi:hypothetical protein